MISKPLVILGLLINTYAAVAQDKTDTAAKALPEVIVVSPYTSSSQSPLTVSNITRKQIRQKNFGQEPSLLIAQTPSVTYYTDAGSGTGYSYFRIRGIDQTRINMSLNGVPLNEPEDQGVYFSNYPDFLESVSVLQIQRGTGYSKNGVAAYGGSLYFESLLYRDSAGGGIAASYGSFNSYRLNAAVNTGMKNRQGLYIRASHLHSDGYKDHSGNTSSSVFLNYGYQGTKHDIYLLSFAGNQKNELAWIGSPMDSLKKSARYNANSKNENDAFFQAHLQLHDNWKINDANQLHTGVFYNYLDGNYDFDLNNFLGLPPGNELYNYAFRSNYLGVFSYHSYQSKSIKWFNGVQTQWYSRRHTGTEQTTGFLYQNTGYRKESSIFSKLLFNTGRWNLLGDIQYRYSQFTYKGNEQMPGQYWSFLNATMGINYSFSKSMQVYYSLAQIHREPTRNDLFFGNDDLLRDNNGDLIFNPVKPERAIDHELGIKYFSERAQVFANLYYMSFRNEITLNGQIGPTGVPLHSTAAKSFRSGLELDALYRFENGIELQNQSSASINRIKETGVRLQPVMTPYFISNQQIRLVQKKWQTGFTARYQSESYIDYANSYKLPAYFIVNWNGSWYFHKFTFSGAINNITNRTYYTNALVTATGLPGYFVQAPVNFFAGVRLEW